VISGRNIICLASNWCYDPTSKHHVMKRLAERNHVIWVNYHASRRPGVSAADASAAARKLRQVIEGPRRISDSMTVVTPLVVPLPGSAMAARLNQTLLTRQIHAVLRTLPTRPVQLWLFAPDADYLVGRFGEECVVYYCVDEFSQFSGYDAASIRQAEARLCAAADLVVTTSASLFEAKRRMNARTILLTHGVDFDHFAKAAEPVTPVPEDVSRLPRPILGFWGLIQDWVDLELVAAIAKGRPHWPIVMIGERAADTSALSDLPNVHLLGRRPYDLLPQYAKAFSVGMIPFRRNGLTEAVNPIKLREYLSAGLPVVATGLPEVRRYERWVRIADSAEGWIRAIEEITAADGAGQRGERRAAMRNETWAAKVAELEAHVAKAMAGSRGKACSRTAFRYW